jgi:hypothetical protein
MLIKDELTTHRPCGFFLRKLMFNLLLENMKNDFCSSKYEIHKKKILKTRNDFFPFVLGLKELNRRHSFM